MNWKMNYYGPGVDLHDPGPGLLGGSRELDLTVETTGAEQGRVQDIHSVGSSNHFNVVLEIKETRLFI